MEINPQKIIELSKLGKNGLVAVAKYVFKLEDRVDSIQGDVLDMGKKIVDVEKKLNEQSDADNTVIQTIVKGVLKDVKGDKGDKPIAGVDYEIPEHGKDYVLTESDKVEIAKKVVVPVVEKIIERTEVIKEVPIITNEIKEVVKEVAPEIQGEQIVDKINSLPIDPQSQIGKEHIKGLVEELKRISALVSSNPTGRGVRKITYMRKFSLTDQCNGVTKTFTLPNNTMDVVGVFGTQFPVQFDPSADWTFSGRTLTLGASVSAPDTGQSLWALIESLY